jgi:anti-sigma factor RsiW
MSCDEVGKWLQHHLDGVLDEGRSARLVAHLDDCRRCGLEAETYEQIKRSLADSASSVPADSLDRLRTFAGRLARGEEQLH